MKRQKKQYSRPKRPWSSERIEKEGSLLKEYGLRRKKEIWKAGAILRNFRSRARELAKKKDTKKEMELLEKLNKLELVPKEANLDNVLALTLEDILSRRLQSIVFKKGFAQTPLQARQFIVHGHIVIGDRRLKWPSALITGSDETKIGYDTKSKVLKEWVLETKNKGIPSAPLSRAGIKPAGVEALQPKVDGAVTTTEGAIDAEPKKQV